MPSVKISNDAYETVSEFADELGLSYSEVIKLGVKALRLLMKLGFRPRDIDLLDKISHEAFTALKILLSAGFTSSPAGAGIFDRVQVREEARQSHDVVTISETTISAEESKQEKVMETGAFVGTVIEHDNPWLSIIASKYKEQHES